MKNTQRRSRTAAKAATRAAKRKVKNCRRSAVQGNILMFDIDSFRPNPELLRDMWIEDFLEKLDFYTIPHTALRHLFLSRICDEPAPPNILKNINKVFGRKITSAWILPEGMGKLFGDYHDDPELVMGKLASWTDGDRL